MITIKSVSKVLLLALGLTAASSSFATTVLRVGTWLAPTHPQNAVVWTTWAKWVEDATDGRVKVKIEYGVGNPKTMFQLVEDDVVDASWSYHGYVPGRFKLPEVVELPGLGVNAEAASVALWRVQNKYFNKANEFDGLELLGMFTHGPGYIHSRNPITSWDQIKGLKIRIGGGVQSELGKRMGITPVGAPAPKVYEMMQQGVIDGVFLPMGEQKFLRLSEVAPNVTMVPGGMYLGSFSMFINPDFMASLSKKDRDAILSVSGEKLSAMAGRAWDEGDREGLNVAKAAGVNLIKLKESDPMATQFNTMIIGMKQQWIDSVADRHIDAKAAVDDLWKIARDYQHTHSM